MRNDNQGRPTTRVGPPPYPRCPVVVNGREKRFSVGSEIAFLEYETLGEWGGGGDRRVQSERQFITFKYVVVAAISCRTHYANAQMDSIRYA